MPETEPHRKILEIREPRKADWSRVRIFIDERRDRQMLREKYAEHAGAEIERSSVEYMIGAVEHLLNHPHLILSSREARQLEVLLSELKTYDEIIYERGIDGVGLETRVKQAKQFQDAEITDIKRERLMERAGIRMIGNHGHEILYLSDSHATTDELLFVADFSGFTIGEQTALLDFDNHSDICITVFAPLRKDNQHSYVLHGDTIGASAVLGTFLPETDEQLQRAGVLGKVDVVPGANFYGKDGPSKELFYQHLRRIFRKWKRKRITQIFPNIDLDFLRLPEIGYTGVDYMSISFVKKIVAEADYYKSRYNNLDNLEVARVFMTELLANYLAYQGLPASWPLLALEMARDEFGFKIGLHHPRTGQVVVGDLTECTGYDRGGRTFAIMQVLANGLVHLAQHQ